MTQQNLDSAPGRSVQPGTVIDGRRLMRPCGAHGLASRWLASDLRRQTDCLVYVFDRIPEDSRPGLWRALGGQVGVRRSHTLTIESAGRERGGLVWASAVYPGSQDGVLTLEDLRRSKGGVFTVFEAGRAVEQLLDAAASAHRVGSVHGVVSPGEVLVTTRGTLLVELYGLSRLIDPPIGGVDEARQDEVRSIAGIAWRLLTGLAPEERDVFGGQARRLLDPAWAAWLELGLDQAGGFADAGRAIEQLPGRSGVDVRLPSGRARAWLDRLSSAVAVRRASSPGLAKEDAPAGGLG